MHRSLLREGIVSMRHTPYTLDPCTLHLEPFTLHPIPYTLPRPLLREGMVSLRRTTPCLMSTRREERGERERRESEITGYETPPPR